MVSIQDRLAAIAERFLEQAETATNPKTALSSLNVVEKSVDLLEKFKAVIGPESVWAFVSVLSLESAYSKPELWRAYLDFCRQADLHAVSGREFVSGLERAGFIFHRSHGKDKVFPPQDKGKLMEGAEKLCSTLDIQLMPLTEYPVRRRGRG